MTSFLTKKRNAKSFEEKLSTAPKQTQRNKKYAIKLFEDFIKENYNGRPIQEIIKELRLLRRTQDQETYDEALYGMLQEWIIWNEKHGRGNYTIRVVFSNLRKYLFHVGIKTHNQDIKEFLLFGKRSKEEMYPLNQEEYRKIVNGFSRNLRLQVLFLALGSSGMRIGEALNLKKKDLDFSKERVKVNISSETKTRTGRTTYFSKETEKLLRPILEKLEPDDYVFAKKNHKLLAQSVRKALNRLLDRIEFTETYQSNKYRKITSHSFRAYFFTKAARKHGENYAHKMIGHGGYLMQYDRLTEEEKLKMYAELEPDLVIYDQTKNELKIDALSKKTEEIEYLKREVIKLQEQQVIQDKRILGKMREEGLLPKLSK